MGQGRLAVACGSALGVEAARRIAENGGNAVDACLASAVMAWVTEPFFAAIGGSGFITIRTPEGEVEVIDGNNIMPFTIPGEPGQGMRRIFLPDYADGIYMGIGAGSIAVPGILAAVHKAWERHGKIEWAALFEPAIDVAVRGVPFPAVSDYYLSCTWDAIWSTYPEPRERFSVDGRPMRENELLVQPDLAESLRKVGKEGPDAFYRGELAETIVDRIAADGGFITMDDFDRYEAEIREPVTAEAFGWKVWSNPPPSVGGAVLVHMLAILESAEITDDVSRLRTIVEAQSAAMGYRRDRYVEPADVAAAFEEALESLKRRSSATTHSSAADRAGYACALTESNGYGSGLVIHGMLMNNTLGEEELNPRGAHRLPPGSRCHSNMAPTIVTGDGRTIALGSPGADRIVPAIAQTILRLAMDGGSLAEAVGGPRAYLDARPEGETLCFEPGLPGDSLEYVPRPYDKLHMFFGGVQAASVSEDGAIDAVHDPRRSGGSAIL